MKPGQDSDEWLMAQVALGSREHLSPLLHKYANSLLTFIQRMTGNRHRAEELFQEVFLTVWVKSRHYQHPRPFRPWLFGIAAKKCQADYRRRREEVHLGIVATAESRHCSPEDMAFATERAGIVKEILARLPEAQRTVVVLRIWNDLPYAEIAEIVGRTESTVRSHMFHALTTMRRALEPRL